MPYILKRQEIPYQMTKNDNKVYKIFLYLNILMSFIDGATYFGFWKSLDNSRTETTFNYLNVIA